MMIQLAVSFCWFTLGAMLFFGAIVAPIVFTVLDETAAGQFLRRLFPRIYMFCGLFSGLSAVLFAAGTHWPATAALAVTSALFFFARGPLTQKINDTRDAQLAGDAVAGQRFDRLHKLSTRIFGLQFLTLLTTAIWLGLLT